MLSRKTYCSPRWVSTGLVFAFLLLAGRPNTVQGQDSLEVLTQKVEQLEADLKEKEQSQLVTSLKNELTKEYLEFKKDVAKDASLVHIGGIIFGGISLVGVFAFILSMRKISSDAESHLAKHSQTLEQQVTTEMKEHKNTLQGQFIEDLGQHKQHIQDQFTEKMAQFQTQANQRIEEEVQKITSTSLTEFKEETRETIAHILQKKTAEVSGFVDLIELEAKFKESKSLLVLVENKKYEPLATKLIKETLGFKNAIIESYSRAFDLPKAAKLIVLFNDPENFNPNTLSKLLEAGFDDRKHVFIYYAAENWKPLENYRPIANAANSRFTLYARILESLKYLHFSKDKDEFLFEQISE